MQAEPFSTDQLQAIYQAISAKYNQVAQSAEGFFRYPTGRDGAVALGYEESVIADMPADLLNAFCGVGNPFAIDDIHQGSAVLDIGCGAGFDLFVARKKVGSGGRVCGIDLTAKMLERAQEIFHQLAIDTIETVQVDSEIIPYNDSIFDVVISNGVINLSPQKLKTFQEIRRVLKAGGTLQFADIVLEKALPAAMASSVEEWAQ